MFNILYTIFPHLASPHFNFDAIYSIFDWNGFISILHYLNYFVV